MEDGSVVCRLLAGKTRVAPKCKISIPRMELMGSLVAVRLYQKIKDSLRMDVEGVRFFTDSSAVLGSGTFLEFVGIRVSEIRTKSKVDRECTVLRPSHIPRKKVSLSTRARTQSSCTVSVLAIAFLNPVI
jgi:hypothetical protein